MIFKKEAEQALASGVMFWSFLQLKILLWTYSRSMNLWKTDLNFIVASIV